MAISVQTVKDILKTLPTSYYLGGKCEVTFDEKAETSYCNPMTGEIVVAFNNVVKALDGDVDVMQAEKFVRGALYHELSHLLLTPKGIENTNQFNIVEDERIESVLKDYYMRVNFKEFVLRMNHWTPDWKPSDVTGFFFGICRFRQGPKEFVDRAGKIIARYAMLDGTTELSSTYSYVSDVNALWDDVCKYWKQEQQNQQNQQNQNQQNQQSNENSEQNQSGGQDSSEQNQSGGQAGDDSNEQSSDDSQQNQSGNSDNGENSEQNQSGSDGDSDKSEDGKDGDKNQSSENGDKSENGEENGNQSGSDDDKADSNENAENENGKSGNENGENDSDDENGNGSDNDGDSTKQSSDQSGDSENGNASEQSSDSDSGNGGENGEDNDEELKKAAKMAESKTGNFQFDRDRAARIINQMVNKFDRPEIRSKMEQIIIKATKKHSQKSPYTNAYSGRIDPRSVAFRTDYRWFTRKGDCGSSKYDRLHVTLWVDNSGSFHYSIDNINALVFALNQLAKKMSSDFCFDIVTMNNSNVKHDRTEKIESSGSNKFGPNIENLAKQTNKVGWSNWNIAVWDGDLASAYYYADSDSIVSQNRGAFNVFNNSHSIIVSDPSNSKYLDRGCPNAKKRYIQENYSENFIDAVLELLDHALC